MMNSPTSNMDGASVQGTQAPFMLMFMMLENSPFQVTGSEIRNQKSDCDWNEPVYPGRYCSFTHSPNYVCSPHWRGMCRVRHIGMTRCCQRASISALSNPQLKCLTLT